MLNNISVEVGKHISEEIFGHRYHHHHKAQYTDPTYNDSDPQIYFYAEKYGRAFLKMNLRTLEFRFPDEHTMNILTDSYEMWQRLKAAAEIAVNSQPIEMPDDDDDTTAIHRVMAKFRNCQTETKKYLTSLNLI
jgi:hypothetical protein